MEKVSRARSSLVSKKMRLRLESLHVPRAAQQHAHPMPPKAHCPHADSRPCRQGARDCGPSPGSPSPVVLHDLRACPGTGLECVSSGAWGQGSLEAFLLVLALLGRTHAVGTVGTLGNLETSLGLLARPRGRRQETKTAGGGWLTTTAEISRCGLGRPGSAATRTWRGVPCPPQGLLPELASAENTGTESLSPRWVFLGLTGVGVSIGEFEFIFFVVFYFCS